MTEPLILASGSAIRAQLLTHAGLSFTVQPSRVDEDTIKDQCLANGLSPKAVALRLAQEKARDVSANRAGFVIGADSVVELERDLISNLRICLPPANSLKPFPAVTIICIPPSP